MKTAYGVEIPDTVGELLNPKACALIVYDMQAGIIRQIKDGAAITAKVQQVLNTARDAGMRVFYTRHLSLPKQLMGSLQFRMAMSWQRQNDPEKVEPWFLRGTPGFEIVSELEPRPDEAVFDKLAMSAFEGTPLAFSLRDCGIRSFLITGVAMEIGIDLTCRHGADLGFVPAVVRDACGAGHLEAAERAIATLEFLGDTVFVDTTSLGQILKAPTSA